MLWAIASTLLSFACPFSIVQITAVKSRTSLNALGSQALPLQELRACNGLFSRGKWARESSMSRHVTEEPQETASDLLVAKTAINHMGDVENIAKFIEMLKAAKTVLFRLLTDSEGLMTPMISELVAELGGINPLTKPAEDMKLLSGKYTSVSCIVKGKWGAKIASGDLKRVFPSLNCELSSETITLESTTVTFSPSVSSAGKKPSCEAKFSIQIDSITEHAEAHVTSAGPRDLSFGFKGADQPVLHQVTYLDQDLLILNSEDSTWVLTKQTSA